jgi:hypothetical protein
VSQQLVGPSASRPVDVARRLLAIQSQDLRGARLAIRARSTGTVAADIDHALSVERSLVVSWLNRGTLHLVATEDLAWLHALTTPQLATGNLRRLDQEGVPPADAERGCAAIVQALGEDGPLRRAELRERVAAVGVRAEGQALVHLLFLATLQGSIVRGPVVGTEQAFVRRDDWLDPAPKVDLDVAIAELARRYLIGHAPATDRDLAKWAGITLATARAGLRAIGDELVERPDGTVELARHADELAADERPPPTLLGAFDPLLHGWVDRTPIIGDHVGIVTNNGLFRPFLLVDGIAAGLWRLRAGDVTLEPFAPLPRGVERTLDAEADDVQRFLSNAHP